MKYSRTQLGDMARRALAERDRASHNWILLLLTLSARTGQRQDLCITLIEKMATWK
jgi:hypothetical protein